MYNNSVDVEYASEGKLHKRSDVYIGKYITPIHEEVIT